MSNDNELKVEVGATTDKLTAGMQQASATVKSGVSSIKESFGGIGEVIETAMVPLKMFAAVLAGGAVFKSAIADTVAFTGEVVTLSKKMGMSVEAATTMNIALKLIGASSDDYVNAAMKMDRQLKKNEDGMKTMGIVTRDSSGRLLDQQTLMQNGIAVLSTYKAGTDRNMAATDLFGRSFDEVSKLMKLNNGTMAEAARLQKAYNIEVSADGIQAVKDYKMSLSAMKIALGAIEDAIGKAVIPIINKLGAWFRGEGPQYIGYFIQLLETMGKAFLTLSDIVVRMGTVIGRVFTASGKAISGTSDTVVQKFTVWQRAMQIIEVGVVMLKAAVVPVFEVIGGIVESTINLMVTLKNVFVAFQNLSSDWEGPSKAWAAGMQRDKAIFARVAADNVKTAADAAKEIAEIWSGGPHAAEAPEAKPDKAQKAYVPFDDGGKNKKDKDERMKQWEADLLKQKTNYMLENEMREMSLADETAYWKKIVDSLKDGDHAKSSAKKKQAEAEFAEAKFTAKQMQDLQSEVAQFQEKLDLGTLDHAHAVAEQKLALGLITQLQFLQAEQEFENRRYAINEAALRDRLALLDKDPTHNLIERQKLLDQLVLMEQKHVNDVSKIQNKQALESAKYTEGFANSMQSTFKQSLSGMLQGTTTFAGAIKGLFKGILGAFADMVSGMVSDWLFAMIRNKITQAASGVAQVMSNAAVAASAAFASTAAIPVVGPELAPAAAAAAYSATAAFAPLASARNGFDIPAGLNPVTQLHEREMVLPQAQADAVRDMAAGGGGGGAVHLHVHALDAKSVERLFKDNGRHIATALQGQVRNFAVKGV